ncbi:caspase domain-containing protein [Xylaria sp. FL1777]|nr:caspase domain-containing protein [Xylaria sp. FL1777]
MNNQSSPRRFALLVGVDLYQNNGSRSSKNNNIAFLKNLQGCVNDVRLIKELLRNQFKPDEERVLTSSPSLSNPMVPEGPASSWPTFDNIKRGFENVIARARSGDIFFFHFSGHGALLPRVRASPIGRDQDPSLMTMDYCCGGRPIRGWELNKWLKKLYRRKVQVIVTLDSCYSAGSWRDEGNIRTPEDWSPCNLPSDEDRDEDESEDESAIEGEIEDNGEGAVQDMRKPELPKSWGINPEGFTLMAACPSNKSAIESVVRGQVTGIFTSALSTYFKNQPNAATSTYRAIRDHIAEKIRPQEPEVFGQDRLSFFRSKELFSSSPVWAEVCGNTVTLPLGKIHGIKVGAEFTTRAITPDITFSISTVDDFESIATISQGLSANGTQSIEVLPCRWSENKPIRIVVGPGFSNTFRKKLFKALKKRVSGDQIQITHGFAAEGFRVNLRQDCGIEILAPISLSRYDGPIRGLSMGSFKPSQSSQSAIDCAGYLAHLLRFEQIRDIRNEYYLDFEVSFTPECNEISEGPLPDKQKVVYTFRNNEENELHFAVIGLGAGFDVTQLFPTNDSMIKVPKGSPCSFSFLTVVSEELKGDEQDEEDRIHRDIIRTVVTEGKPISLKSLELPDIWNTNQLENMGQDGPERKTIVVNTAGWCIRDYEIVYKS